MMDETIPLFTAKQLEASARPPPPRRDTYYVLAYFRQGGWWKLHTKYEFYTYDSACQWIEEKLSHVWVLPRVVCVPGEGQVT